MPQQSPAGAKGTGDDKQTNGGEDEELTEVLSDLDGNILAEREALRKPAIPRLRPRHLQVAIQGLKVRHKLAQSHERGVATPRRRLNAGTNPALETRLTPGTTTLLLGNYERPPCKRLTLS